MTDHSTPRPEMRRAKARRGRPQRSRWLAVAGYTGLGLGCLLLGAVTFLLVAAPVDLVRDRLIEQVKSRTGRDLVVSGPTSLVFFPRVAISLANVAFSAPPGMGGAPTLAVQTLEAELGLMSLFTRQAGIKRVTLTRPVIELRVDADGRRSWDFALAQPRRSQASLPAPTGDERPQLIPVSAPAQAQPAVGGGNLSATLDMLSPASVRIVDGNVRYVDERSGLRHDATALDLDLAVDAGAGPLQAKGSFAWRGEKVAVDAALSSLRALVEERRARLSLKLAGQPIEASYEGTLDVAAGLALDGNVSLKSPSVLALGNWTGNKPIAAGRDAGALALSSSLTGGNGRVSLAGLTATLGDTQISGALAIESRPARPYLSGSLKLSQLDLGGILIRPSPNPPPEASPQPSDRRPAQAAPPPRAPQGGGQVRGFTQRAGGGADWSDDIIDVAPLGLADGDLALSADRLIYKDVKTGPVRLSLQLKDSAARLTLEDMLLYDGRGRGVVTLDGRGQAPATTVNLMLEGIAAQPLLKDALGFEWLAGQSSIAVALAGQGVSERQIVTTLNGKIDLVTNNGTIEAVDVGKILRGIEQGRFGGLRVAPGEKTQFSELAGTFNIANGIADNQDLRLVSPSVRVTGAGNFNLPARSLDYTVRPKIAALNATTDRAVINLSNVEIPVRIEGPWDKPNFTVAGQEQLIETVKEIGKNLKSKDVEDALKGLLGGGDGEKKVKPRDLLEKLLKKP
jgi:AsmA protein